MLKKLKFFLIGLVPGLIIVFFVLNKKGAKCSGYLPNSRVIAETLSKEFEYSPSFQSNMDLYNIDQKFLRDSIITHGEIDFEKSHPQNMPCPDYILTFPKEEPVYEISFEKCKEKAKMNSLRKL